MPIMTQKVSDVEINKGLIKECTSKEVIEKLIGSQIEACSKYGDAVINCDYHPFMEAVYGAYAFHYPIHFSPDMFWLLVTQGFANHVNFDAEKMRRYFVKHEGKVKIIVRRDDFIKGSPENDWQAAFGSFSEKIKEHIGKDNYENIVVDFSTTGPIEKAANEVILMDSMKSYFDYEVHTLCGIPEVIIEGKVSDWELLRNKIETLGKSYDLQWWTDLLLPVFEKIVENVSGKDNGIWKDIYKESDGSGGPFIGGWIINFFPYIYNYDKTSLVKNKYIGTKSVSKYFDGITTSNFSSGLHQVPFIWKYYDQIFNMDFCAGFVSCTQNKETFALRPEIGWAVKESKTKE